MKRNILLILFGVWAITLKAQTFSNNNAVSIPDNNSTGAYSEINVTGLNPVSQVASVQINISHSYDADLTIYLEFYDSSWLLSGNNGGSGDNYSNTVFTNTATTSITSGAAPFNGTFLPEQNLPDFLHNFNPNGVWRLHVIDNSSGASGTINSWSITFETPPCPNVNFINLPATMNCSDANIIIMPDTTYGGNGIAFPSLFFEFNIDASSEGNLNDNLITLYEDGNAFYQAYVTTDRLTIYPNGALYDPSSNYTWSMTDNDGTMSWLVYDGNGTVLSSGSFTNGSQTQGPVHPAGTFSWDCTPTNGITGVAGWGPAQFSPSVVGPGTYTVTYTWDNQGSGAHHCTGSSSHSVTISNTWNASWNPPDTVCESGSSITLSDYITGDGGGNFTGQGVSGNTFNPSGLSGNINITYSVGNSSACFDSQTQTIYVVPTPSVDAGNDINICGLDTVNLTGSATNYSSVQWTTSNGTGTIQNANSLNASYIPGPADITHTVTFTLTAYSGNSSCSSASDNVNVTFNEKPSVSVTTSDVTTCTNPNGEIHISATGGTSPYQYSIDGGNTFSNSGDFTGLNAGTYQVVVTDQYGCTSDITNVDINNANGLNIDSVHVDNISCFGESTGSITIYATGSGLIYSIDGGSNFTSSNTFTNLNAGTYNIVIYDDGGCSESQTVTITEPAELTGVTTIQPITCYGNCDGSININASGGTAPYNYLWNNNATTSEITGLCAGQYSVTVTDANGCNFQMDTSLIEPEQIETNYNVSSILCGNDTASITLSITGGTEPMHYQWSNGDTSSVLQTTTSGNYSVTITDAHGCQDTLEDITITMPDPIIITDEVTIGNDHLGYIDITVSGGTSPYSYLWNTGATIEDLSAIETSGTYIITVTDVNNCSVSDSIEVKLPLTIPTIITPNNDGKNDTWKIINIEHYKKVLVEVYNRWGNIIFHFEGTGAQYMDKENQWDGTYNGKTVPLGAYLYVVKVDNEIYKGTIIVK